MVPRERGTINFTRAAEQSHARLSMLAARLGVTASSGVDAQTPLRPEKGATAYDMEFSIGTPPQKLSAIADTGSDLVWTKCGKCASCTPQGSPSYYPTKSSSFSKLPCSATVCTALQSLSIATCSAGGAECDYKYTYGFDPNGGVYTKGYLATETFTLGSDAVRGIGFGCSNVLEGNVAGTSSGLVGLNRGAPSLVSQLKVGAFSYCLTADASKATPLLFGSEATLTGPGVQSTPLVTNSTLYVVDLPHITIGGATTVGTDDNTTVVDCGATLTYLAEPAYTAAKKEFLARTALVRTASMAGYEACFRVPSTGPITGVPSMVLNFKGADMKLPMANYFQRVASGVGCWMVQKSPIKVSLIGNIMQRDFHIRYDIENSKLSFQPANCASLISKNTAPASDAASD